LLLIGFFPARGLALIPALHGGLSQLWCFFLAECSTVLHSSLVCNLLILIFHSGSVVWIVAGTHLHLTFELPVQKDRGFVVLVVLSPWLLDSTNKLFGEMTVRLELLVN
jgi:hypothetical protein